MEIAGGTAVRVYERRCVKSDGWEKRVSQDRDKELRHWGTESHRYVTDLEGSVRGYSRFRCDLGGGGRSVLWLPPYHGRVLLVVDLCVELAQ